MKTEWANLKTNAVRGIVNELRNQLKSIAGDIEERATKNQIVFRSSVNFAAINPQIKQYWFRVKVKGHEAEKQFPSLDVRPQKDKFFTFIRCNAKTDIAQLVKLAEQAYQKTL